MDLSVKTPTMIAEAKSRIASKVKAKAVEAEIVA
jgi:hypothetical protein